MMYRTGIYPSFASRQASAFVAVLAHDRRDETLHPQRLQPAADPRLLAETRPCREPHRFRSPHSPYAHSLAHQNFLPLTMLRNVRPSTFASNHTLWFRR